MRLDLIVLKRMLRAALAPGPSQGLDLEAIRELARGIATTRPDEIGCDECFEGLDRFVEEMMAGKDVVEALPLVQDHLDRCPDCREEFEALLAAMGAETGGASRP